MEKKSIECKVTILSYDELDEKDVELVEKAKQATSGSYSPYSQFSVGAAVRLADGTIVTGNNQENASYPCGMCAERTALFYANAQYPTLPVKAIAIAAKDVKGFLTTPITPCGACRQALLETELRYKQMIKVLLYGTEKIYCVNSITELLPLQFTLS